LLAFLDGPQAEECPADCGLLGPMCDERLIDFGGVDLAVDHLLAEDLVEALDSLAVELPQGPLALGVGPAKGIEATRARSHPQESAGRIPTVSREDEAVPGYHDWLLEPMLLDAACQGLDLRVLARNRPIDQLVLGGRLDRVDRKSSPSPDLVSSAM